MGYSATLYHTAMQTLARRKAQAETQAEERLSAFYTLCPEARAIDASLSATALTAARIVLQKHNAAEALQELEQENLALQEKRKALLAMHQLTEDSLMPQYTCPICEDTGYKDGRQCQCLKQLLRTLASQELSNTAPLEASTFASFSLDYYPDTPYRHGDTVKQHMEKLLNRVKIYADTFTPHSPSLLFYGGTGLGKTHLSLAVANVVLQKGYSVVCDSVHNLIAKLEREHFGKQDGDTGSTLLDCDLLILDDLGTEFRTSFSVAEIYHVVNTRLMANRPTIISTNLSTQELEQAYSLRFVSRVRSSYTILPFAGSDIRQIRAKERFL